MGAVRHQRWGKIRCVWYKLFYGFGHSVLNVGDGEAEFLLVHNNGDFSTIELSEWVSGGPKDVFASTLNVPEDALDKVPKKKLFLARKSRK